MEGRTRSVVPLLLILVAPLLLTACPPPPVTDPGDLLRARGQELFFNETFDGNGRTCGTCHPAENDFTIDPAFIATLPDDDPLFVAEFVPALSENFEKPELMREFGLILENLDGFDDLESVFTLRGVPHTLGLTVSVGSSAGPRTGWSGDGAPGDGTLRSFATGAVIQHFTKSIDRVAGVDFRLPTDEELDALEAFQLSLGRQRDLILPLSLKGTVARRGQEIFLDDTLGKCNICHNNAGANAVLRGNPVGNANFNTGVENLPDQPQDLTGQLVPPDDGLGRPGTGEFNTPPVVEAADTGPFFHNNAIETIEGAVAFYNGDSFNNSPSGQVLASVDPNGVGIRLDATQVVEVAAFLRVLNALENVRISLAQLEPLASKQRLTADEVARRLRRALAETDDAIRVLRGGGLHPGAVERLTEARGLTERAANGASSRRRLARQAMDEHRAARARMVEASSSGDS